MMKKNYFLIISVFLISFLSGFARAETPNLLDGVVDKYFKGKVLTKSDDITFDVAKRALDGTDRKSTRLNSSHIPLSRMPSSA